MRLWGRACLALIRGLQLPALSTTTSMATIYDAIPILIIAASTTSSACHARPNPHQAPSSFHALHATLITFRCERHGRLRRLRLRRRVSMFWKHPMGVKNRARVWRGGKYDDVPWRDSDAERERGQELLSQMPAFDYREQTDRAFRSMKEQRQTRARRQRCRRS